MQKYWSDLMTLFAQASHGVLLFAAAWLGPVELGSIQHPAIREVTAATWTAELQRLPEWSIGILDIHHIQTGRGNAGFAIFPDGTTLLIDAGALDDDWARNYEPLKQAPAVPNSSRRPGEWIADYIAQFAPKGATGLDYAVVTHFHSDHFGRVQSSSPVSQNGDWKLSGLTDVAERWPILNLIDRDYPNYAFPVSLRKTKDRSLQNYFGFVDSNVASGRMNAHRFAVGRDDQIACRADPKICQSFSVRNIASNGVVWTGIGNGTQKTLDATQITDASNSFNENPLSIVLKINYGDFDYVTGGDLTGIDEPDQPEWFAMEAKVAPAVGEVDAMTLNHHGNRDSTSTAWLKALMPRILIQQTWVSDHPGGEVVERITSRKLWPHDRDIFATYVHEEAKTTIGPRLTHNYKSTAGHVVIRVAPGGQSYKVFILNDRNTQRKVKAEFGPYLSR